MTKHKVLSMSIAVALLLPYGAAQAATATTTFTVSATVANSCNVSSGNVSFGSVNAGAAATNTATNITLTCNKGATVAVALDNGSNPSGTQKQMKDSVSGDFLNYNIDVPGGAALTTCPAAGAGSEWNGTNTVTASGLYTSNGGPKPIKICASIPVNQYPSAGSYSDTVQVTATYN